MNEIDLKSIIKQHPDCVTNGTKLKAILLDLYPNVSRGVVNSIITILNSGIADEIQQSKAVGDIEINRWLNILENDYCMSGTVVKDCLQLWINTLKFRWGNKLLNDFSSVNEGKTKDWIKQKLSYINFDDEIDDAEWNKIDWDSFQSFFVNSDSNNSKQSIVKTEIENAINSDELCPTLSDYIINCAYILVNLKENAGFAFFKLAKGLHICDFSIRDFDPDAYAFDKIPMRLKWSKYSNELNAICELINYKTNNVNVLIEKLLLLAWESGYETAAVALENTYTNKWSYEDVFEEWNDYRFFPWFDITCMDNNFDLLSTELNFENYKRLDHESLLFYSTKALNVLFSDKTKISKDLEDSLIDFYESAVDILDKNYIDNEIPYIEKKAYEGIPKYKKLIDIYKNKQILETGIEELGLSTQTYSLLRRANFHTIGDVIRKSKSKFLTIKRFGEGRLNEVIEALGKYNLSLSD